MDPLSITASVVGISGACAAVINTLKEIHDKYKQADLTVLAICSESATVQAALAQIESLLREDGDAVVSRFTTQPVLAAAFDTAITGCQMVYSCLDAELRELAAALQRDGSLDWKRKFKTVWKQETMAGFQQQIRGQVLALNTLLQSLQMESLGEMRRLLQSQQAQLDQINENTTTLRKQYPQSTVPDSIFDNKRSAGSIFGATDSVLGAEDFAFDDDIVNSKAYRRAMALAQAQFENLQIATSDGPATSDQASAASSETPVPRTQEAPAVADEAVAAADPKLDVQLAWQAPSNYRSFITNTTPLDEKSLRLPNDWATAFGLTKDSMGGRHWKDLQYHNILWEILQTEHQFINSLAVIERLFVTPIMHSWPQLVSKPVEFAERVFAHVADVRRVHEQMLYLPMLANWEREGAWAEFHPEPFIALAEAAEGAHMAFARNFESAQKAVEKEVGRNESFRAFVESRRQHPWCERLSWDSFLKAPITRLSRLRLLLAAAGRSAQTDDARAATVKADSRLILLLQKCESSLQLGQRRQPLLPIIQGLSVAQATLIRLDSPERRLIMEGYFQILFLFDTEQRYWAGGSLFLLDNGLVVGEHTPDRPLTASVVHHMFVHSSKEDTSYKFGIPLSIRGFIRPSAKTLYPLKLHPSDKLTMASESLAKEPTVEVGFTSKEDRDLWVRRINEVMSGNQSKLRKDLGLPEPTPVKSTWNAAEWALEDALEGQAGRKSRGTSR
ncbi:hypothetical protein LTR53_012250 [Teratosphaeriaceae sp. CCFEE 6253]|nr:hypothetical protein LTR53_012250 [Teratosphaeriaceae sp. CCFEE 6253]